MNTCISLRRHKLIMKLNELPLELRFIIYEYFDPKFKCIKMNNNIYFYSDTLKYNGEYLNPYGINCIEDMTLKKLKNVIFIIIMQY